jgi:hypothetical protein
MMNPPQGKIRGKTLMKTLVKCSSAHDDCRSCGWPKYCEFYHDFLIETEAITNWQGVNKNVTRYYQ